MPVKTQIPSKPAHSACEVVAATIAASATDSSIVNKRGYPILGIVTDADFDGTAITFKVGNSATDASGFVALQGASGANVTVTGMAPSKAYPLPAELAPFPYFIVVASAQAGNTTDLTIHMSA